MIPCPSTMGSGIDRPTRGASAAYERLDAEQRALELGVDALEGAVLPVEAPAGLRRSAQHREQDRVEERAVYGRVVTGAREARRGRLAAQLTERDPGIGELREPEGPRLHVVADERPVLVEAGAVLVEDERDLSPARLRRELGERCEAERAHSSVKVRSRTAMHLF